MSRAVQFFNAHDLAVLKADVDAWFVTQPNIRLINVGFLARDIIATRGLELALSIQYDDGGALLTDPFTLETFPAQTPAELHASILDWIALNPTAFIGGPLIDYLGQRRRLNDYIAIIITNTSEAEGNAAWLVNQSLP